MKKFLFSNLIPCLCMLIFCLSCPDRAGAQETAAQQHQELKELAEQGELTVSALRGWGGAAGALCAAGIGVAR